MSSIYQKLKIESVSYEWSKSPKSMGIISERKQFRKFGGKYLHMTFSVYAEPTQEEAELFREISVLLYNDDRLFYDQHTYFNIYEDSLLTKFVVTIDFDAENGFNACEINTIIDIRLKDENEDIFFYDQINILDLVKGYRSSFDVEVINLFRKTQGEDIDYEKQNNQSSFNIEDLEAIHTLISFSALEGELPELELFLTLYDELGRTILKKKLMSQSADTTTPEKGELYYIDAYLPDIEKEDSEREFTWEEGSYVIEVTFMDEKVVVLPIEIGDKDIESIFSKASTEPQTQSGGKKIVRTENVEDPLKQLDSMIGLGNVKKFVKDLYDSAALFNERNKMGLPTKPLALHTVFVGNPGTGKTTIATLLGKVMKDAGLLSKGHVVFEERSTLVGQFYGSENEKTLKALERAKGGILFIDEAYTLFVKGDMKDPGPRVLETLLTALSDENNRDWCLVLAGYPAPMVDMLNANVGLKSRIPHTCVFDDYSVDELMSIVDLYCTNNQYRFTKDAKKMLKAYIKRDWSLRDEKFGNGRYAIGLIEKEILPAMSRRISCTEKKTYELLTTIEQEDIPRMRVKEYDKSVEKLNKLVGLNDLKEKVESHLNYVQMMIARQECGIQSSQAPMHMIFTGNPGTGKTTVANLIGDIYASLGILSRGEVIQVDRTSLVGKHIGETESNMRSILEQAKGNVLFIDEAYALHSKDSKNDFGKHVIESLLTVLSKDEIDMLVIMAGYTEEMEELLNSNPGLKSRFPHWFSFKDYTVEELFDIANYKIENEGYKIEDDAKEALKALIIKESNKKEKHFGNGRFVSRLISTQIIPKMSGRIAQLTKSGKVVDPETLQTIIKSDIPISQKDLDKTLTNSFDEERIQNALDRLDKLVGLKRVKEGVRNFVEVSRYLNGQGRNIVGEGVLKWSFLGNSGTGKSTVAEIFADILGAMNILDKGHLVELKAEEIYNIPEYRVSEILKKAMERSQGGLLFIDGDAPEFKNRDNHFDSEKLRILLTSNSVEMPGEYALVIAEHASQHQSLVKSLADNGVVEFDHTFIFDDYTKDELLMILIDLLGEKGHIVTPEAKDILSQYIEGLCCKRDLNFANARTMKLLARAISKNALLRESRLITPNKADIIIHQHPTSLIIKEDVNAFTAETIKPPIRKIGFRE